MYTYMCMLRITYFTKGSAFILNIKISLHKNVAYKKPCRFIGRAFGYKL
ncbi:MAG: hypothetical protein JWQ66_3406 [Mucilaginibacter sp.]|nr:hypothetical protein [Mucilaginibacter sp.]